MASPFIFLINLLTLGIYALKTLLPFFGVVNNLLHSDTLRKLHYMKIKYFIYTLLIISSTACRPFESLFSKNNQPSTNKEAETPAASNAEEALLLQARIAAEEQAARRAEMARLRRAKLDSINAVQSEEIVSLITIEQLEKKQEEEKIANRKAAIEQANKEVATVLEAEKTRIKSNKVTISDRIDELKTKRATKLANKRAAELLEAERLAEAETSTPEEPATGSETAAEGEQIPPAEEVSIASVEHIGDETEPSTNEEKKSFFSFLKKDKNKNNPVTDTPVNQAEEGSTVDDNTPISLDIIESDVASETQEILAPTLKPFYFPIDELEAAKAYRYVPDDGSSDTTYWLMKTIAFGGKSFLITEKYDHNFTLIASIRERLNEVGAFVESYTAYENNGLGGAQAVEYWIDDNEEFRWNMDNGRFAMVTMNYNSNEFLNYDITSYRERHFREKSGSFSYQNRTVETIILEDKLVTVYVDNKNNEESYPSSCENHFAVGIGLVKYTIFNKGDGFSVARTYTLDRIMDYNEWQRISQ